MAVRLAVVAHGPTERTRDAVFGDRSDLVSADHGTADRVRRVRHAVAGTEPACAQTARSWEVPAEVVGGLSGPQFGSWQGRTLNDVADHDVAGLQAWSADPDAAPHGGESLSDLIKRVGDVCDATAWPDGGSVAFVTPLVARAVAVHALGGPAELIFRLDVAPGGQLLISRSGPSWRLQSLVQALHRPS